MSAVAATETGDDIAALKRKHLALFEPSSIAIVGASSSPLKWGFRILYNTIMGGYKGALYAVNPKHTEIIGVDCYPSISALPEKRLDLAVIVVPPPLVIGAVRECAACGCLLYTSPSPRDRTRSRMPSSA